MNSRIALSLSVIALTSSLVSCSTGSEVAPDASPTDASPTVVAPVETAPVETPPPAPDVIPGSDPEVTKAPEPIMTPDAVTKLSDVDENAPAPQVFIIE